jgi:single-strand selective monofunctional uracil DNA glycosylase
VTLSRSERLIVAARRLSQAVGSLRFASPVTHIYNPLAYAWATHEQYLRRFGNSRKRVLFLGMNPGPFGMVQTGVPFGEVDVVRHWLRIEGTVGRPAQEHPRRLVAGFSCGRSEVSGKRLWGFFARRFGTPEAFFAEHFVMGYCPLAFVEGSGANRTPDKLRASEKAALFPACDEHLRSVVAALEPEWIIALGGFAFERASHLFPQGVRRLGKVLHPSPANPLANRSWSRLVLRELRRLGVWC